MPWMLRSGAYDTICHEHLEYYSLTTIKEILDRVGSRADRCRDQRRQRRLHLGHGRQGVLDADRPEPSVYARWLLAQEDADRVHSPESWVEFRQKVIARQEDLRSLLTQLRDSGATIMALGASTKGNVLMMTTPVGIDLVSKVGDVNPYKYGRFLPGTGVPIVSQEEVLEANPDYLLILPWHFRETFMVSLEDYLARRWSPRSSRCRTSKSLGTDRSLALLVVGGDVERPRVWTGCSIPSSCSNRDHLEVVAVDVRTARGDPAPSLGDRGHGSTSSYVDPATVFIRPFGSPTSWRLRDCPSPSSRRTSRRRVDPRGHGAYWTHREGGSASIQIEVGTRRATKILTCPGTRVLSTRSAPSFRDGLPGAAGLLVRRRARPSSPYELSWYACGCRRHTRPASSCGSRSSRLSTRPSQHLEHVLRGRRSSDLARGYVAVVVNSASVEAAGRRAARRPALSAWSAVRGARRAPEGGLAPDLPSAAVAAAASRVGVRREP